jgi:hypothetical protein
VLGEDPTVLEARDVTEEGILEDYVVDTVFDKFKLFTETWGFTLKRNLDFRKENLPAGGGSLLESEEKDSLNLFVNNIFD